jgi:hypothetical protein
LRSIAVSILAVLAIALGALTAGTGTATAACPYAGCFATSTTVTVPKKVAPRHRVLVKVRVSAASNATPPGTITVEVSKHGKVKFRAVVPNSHGVVGVFTRGFRKGRYLIRAVFTPQANSVFSGSSDSTYLKVKKRRRH